MYHNFDLHILHVARKAKETSSSLFVDWFRRRGKGERISPNKLGERFSYLSYGATKSSDLWQSAISTAHSSSQVHFLWMVGMYVSKFIRQPGRVRKLSGTPIFSINHVRTSLMFQSSGLEKSRPSFHLYPKFNFPRFLICNWNSILLDF